jgi:coproporphyrinogen III oxidase-like Fe-S oxidoreductase
VPILNTLLSKYLRWFNARHLQLWPHLTDYPCAQPGKAYLLYIHVPFCESLCPFCSFHRVRFERISALEYFQALRRELRLYHQAGFNFTELYVGGGTPTVLPEQLATLLELAGRLFRIERISIETNPNHLRQSILQRLQQAGVKRLSVGVQSLEDDLLQAMGRFQPYGSAEQIQHRLRLAQGQFETFNVDMIFNFPHQSMASILRDVMRLKSLQVDQVSYYPLMPATGTRQRISRRIGVMDFSREAQLYRLIYQAMLPEYRPTSAWCFSRLGHDHIIDEYITGWEDYVGIGSGAFSYLDGKLYANSFSLKQYLERIRQGVPGIMASRRLSLQEQVRYDFLMKLFGGAFCLASMRAKYGPDCISLIRKELLLFQGLGALQEHDGCFRLTRAGLYYWVVLMREFFIAVNNIRAQMRALAEIHDHT